MLQMKNGRRFASIRKPNTLDALKELHRAKILAHELPEHGGEAPDALRDLHLELRLAGPDAAYITGAVIPVDGGIATTR